MSWTIVTVGADQCAATGPADAPPTRCPGQAYGPFTDGPAAIEWARGHLPAGLLPHFLLLTSVGPTRTHDIELLDGRFEPLTDRGGPIACSCGWSLAAPESPQQLLIAEAFGRVAGLFVGAVQHLLEEMRVADLPADPHVNLAHWPVDEENH